MIDTSGSLVGVRARQKGFDGLHEPHYAVILPPRQRSTYRSMAQERCGNITSMDMGKILERISIRRKEMGISEQALALQSGMSKDGVRNWRRRYEAGDENAGANVGSISKVAATLGVSELWLLYGIGDVKHPSGDDPVMIKFNRILSESDEDQLLLLDQYMDFLLSRHPKPGDSNQ